MKIKKITLNAFESFLEKTEIDFEQLNEMGIFLITGKTGSGKTSIFDGICYALFGEASGSNRKNEMLRNTNADPQNPTYVEMEFEFHNKNYKIKRCSAYERPKARGEGFTTQAASAELTLDDGSIVAKESDVNEEIRKILQLGKDQFKQICMISQGDFREILLTNSDNRGKIFRELFNTNIYNTFTEQLKSLKSSLESDLKKNVLLYENMINQIVLSENDELADKIRKAKEGIVHGTERIELFEELLEKQKTEYKDANKEINSYDEKLEELIKIIRENELIQKNRETLDGKKVALEQLEKVVSEAEKDYNQWQEKLPEIDNLKNQKVLLEKDLESYTKKDNLVKEKLKLQKDCDLFEETNLNLEKKNKEINGKISELKEKASGFENLYSEKEEKVKVQNELEARIRRMNELLTVIQNLQNENLKLEEVQQEYLKAQEEFDKANGIYEEKNRLYLDNQAGILGKSLEEGKPCPVCGSTHHEKIASVQAGAPSAEELKVYEAKKVASDKVRQEKSQKASGINGSIQQLENSKSTMVKELYNCEKDDDFIVQDFSNSNAELKTLNQEIKNLEEKISEKEKIEKQIPLLQEELSENSELMSSNKEKLAKTKAELESNNKNLEELTKNLKFETKTEAEKEINSVNKCIVEMETSYKTCQNRLSEGNNQLSVVQGEIKSLEENLKGCKQVDITQQKQEKLEIENKISSLEAIKEENSNYISANSTLIEGIKKSEVVVEEKSQKFNEIVLLYNTISGVKAGDNGKISLEDYIQMNYLDKILIRANERLEIMSNGQYILERNEGVKNGNVKSCLDINVRDLYTDKIRSVASLSGGEQFQASLSLALGLSDEVSANAGGKKMDSMFIDEGFGSLDSDETLQMALKALVSLTEGNKTVAIISHVDQVKEKISSQIVVTKDKNSGSKISIQI